MASDDLDEVDLRRVFVPAEDLDAVITKDQRGVLLPRDEFLKLVREAKANSPEIGDAVRFAPAQIVVSGVTYAARFDGEQIVVSAAIKLAQAKVGWQIASLPLAGMSVEGALLNDQPARLGRDNAGQLIVLSDTRGEHLLKLELSAPLTAVGADKVAAVGVLPGIAGTLRIDVPAAKHLQIDGLSIERPAANDQPATYELAVGGKRTAVALQLTDRQRERATDSLIFATTGFGLRVAPGEVTWHAVTTLQVHGARLDRLVCVVPKTLEITDVDSSGLEAWELSDNPADANTTRITLNYRQPFEGSRRVDFRGVMAVPAGESWRVPTLTINQVTSHIGRVLVQHAPAVRLRTVESVGVRTATISEADLKSFAADRGIGFQPVSPGSPSSDPATSERQAGSLSHLLFDVWREDFSLGFVAQPKDQAVQASISSIFDLTAAGLDLITVATMETSFAPLFELEVSLSADWLLTAISVNGQPLTWQVRTREDEPGINHVRIALPQPLRPGQTAKLEVRAHLDPDGWPVEDQPVDVTLPELRLPQSSVTEGTYVVKADADLDVVPGDIMGLDPANVPVPGARLGFMYQDTRFGGTLKIERKPSRVAARTLTFVRLDKQTLHTHFETELEITGGGLRTLDVSLPESAGKDLRFRLANGSARIVEQKSAPGEDGELIWTLRLDRHLVGTDVLVVSSVATRRRTGDPVKPSEESTPPNSPTPRLPASASQAIPALKLKQADRQHGYIAIEAEGDQRLTVMAQDGDQAALPEADPIDLPLPVAYSPSQRIVAAYQYFTGSPRITVADERFDRLAVPTAICREARIASVLSPAGEFQHQATFQFTAVGVQSLRVHLPEWVDGKNRQRSLLWAALIDGQPTEIRRTESSFLIPLSASDDPTAVRTLTLFYRNQIPTNSGYEDQRLRLSGTGQMRQSPPELTVLNGAGASQPMQVLDQKWELSYPSDLRLTDSQGAFVLDPTTPLDRSNWLSDLPQSLSLPDNRGIAVRMIWIAGVSLLLVMILLVRMKRVRRLLEVVVVLGVIGLLFALLLPGGQSARHAAGPMAKVMEVGEAAMSQIAASGDAMDEVAATASAPSPTGAPLAPPMAAESVDRPMEGKGDSAKDASAKEVSESRSDLQKAIRDGAKLAVRREQPKAGADFRAPAKQPKGEKESGFWYRLDSIEQSAVPFDDRSPLRSDKDGKDIQGRRPVALAQSATQSGQTDLSDDDQSVPRPGLVGRDRGGLLSLTMALEAQSGAATKKFRYIGTETAGSGIGLDLEYENRAAGWSSRWLWIAALAFVAWLLPPNRRGLRATWSVLGLTLPLALAAIAPANWQNALDGIFFGTLAAVGLWTLCRVGHWLCDALPRMTSKSFWTQSVTGSTLPLWLLTAMAVNVTNAQAQPATPPVQNAAPVNPNPDIAARPTIVIPYDDPKEPLAATRVYLPYPKFVELWNAAHPEWKRPQPAPWHGQVTEALFVVAPKSRPKGDESAIADVRGRITFFAGKPMWVPIPLKNGVLTETKLNDQPATTKVIDVNGESLVAVHLAEVGLHVLDLAAEMPIQQAGPTGQLTLQLAPVPAGKLLFVNAGEELAFRVNGATNTFRLRHGAAATNQNLAPGKVVSKPASEQLSEAASLLHRTIHGQGAKETYYEVAINAGGELRLAWQPKRMDGAVDAIVQADSTTAVQVEDAGVRIDSQWQFKVPRGTINDVSFALPKELKVRSISGADVGGWELAENVDGRVLRVFLRRAVSDATALRFDLFVENRIADEALSLTVPAFAPLGVSRDFGTVGLFAQPQFLLKNIVAKGLTQINAAQFGVVSGEWRVSGPPVSAFRYTARPFELGFAAQRRTAESTGFAEHAVVIERRKVRMSSRLRWELAGALRSSVAVLLPTGWLPVDVEATALEDWHVDAATNVLTVEFTEPRIGAVEVVLQGNVPKEPDDAVAEITVPTPQDVSKLTTQVAAWFDLAYLPSVSTATGWKSSDPEHCSEELRNKLGRPAKFVFTSNAVAPQILGFDIVKAQPKLSADAVTLVTVSDTAVDYSLALQWRISDAAADTFRFTTPDWLAGKLDFQGAGIRQTRFESAGPNSKRTRWTVTLQDPVESRYFLLATATLPPPAKREVVAPTITFDRAAVDGVDAVEANANAADAAAAPGENTEAAGSAFKSLETQRQYVVVINISSNQLTPVGEASETVPRDELPIVINPSLVDQATAVVRVRGQGAGGAGPNQAAGEGGPRWSIRSFAVQAGAPASVNLADLTTVLAADGTWRMRCLYTIKNRSRQFLALQLPEKSQALSVFVDEQPARLVEMKRSGRTYQLVALPKTSEADLSFQVRLVLSGRLPTALPRGLRFWSKDVELSVPTVVSLSDDKEYGIPVARTLWAVHVPSDWSARAVNDPNRNNLNEQAADTEAVAYRSALLQEANDLMRVVEGTNFRSSQRMQAQNNLKQLGMALRSYSEGANDSAPQSDEGRKLAESLRDFEAKQRDLESRVVIDSDNNFFVAKDQQQAAQAKSAQAPNGRNSNYDLFFGQLGGQGGQAQRGVINLNNGELLLGNSATILTEDVNHNGILDPGEDTNGNGVLDAGQLSKPANADQGVAEQALKFKLNVSGNEGQPASKPQTTRSSKSQAYAGKGINEADRANRRKVATEQLDQLNKAEDSKKQVQQQLQQGKFYSDGVAAQPNQPNQPDQNDGKIPLAQRARISAGINGPGNFGGGLGAGQGGGGFGGQAGGGRLSFGVGVKNYSSNAGSMIISDADGQSLTSLVETNDGLIRWTQTGGLSLPIEIPAEGNVLRFSRASGSPRLALSVRPNESERLSLGIVWTLVWGAVSLWLLRVISGLSRGCVVRQLAGCLCVLGLIGLFVLPSPLTGLSLLIFAISSIVLAIGVSRGPRHNAAV